MSNLISLISLLIITSFVANILAHPSNINSDSLESDYKQDAERCYQRLSQITTDGYQFKAQFAKFVKEFYQNQKLHDDFVNNVGEMVSRLSAKIKIALSQ